MLCELVRNFCCRQIHLASGAYRFAGHAHFCLLTIICSRWAKRIQGTNPFIAWCPIPIRTPPTHTHQPKLGIIYIFMRKLFAKCSEVQKQKALATPTKPSQAEPTPSTQSAQPNPLTFRQQQSAANFFIKRGRQPRPDPSGSPLAGLNHCKSQQQPQCLANLTMSPSRCQTAN